MKKISVAVLGSCATRDNFNSKFNPDYNKYYDCIITQNQTSLISLLSPPTEYREEEMGDLSEYVKRNIRMDFTNELLSLMKEKKPDYLIIDFFADIHFGCLKLNNGNYITNNRWMLWKSDYYKENKNQGIFNEFNIEHDTENYLTAWKIAADNFMNFLKEQLPDCQIIVHKARNSEKYYSDKKLKDISQSGKVIKINVKKLNYLWNELDQYIIDNYNVDTIDLTNNNYYSYNDHPWGMFYVHYSKDYYHDFLNRFHKIVIKNYFSKNTLMKEIVGEINAFDNNESEGKKILSIQDYNLLEETLSELENQRNQLLNDKKKLSNKVSKFERENFWRFLKRKTKKYKLVRSIHSAIKG